LRFIFDPATLSPALISEIFVVSSVGEKKKKKKKKEKKETTRDTLTRERLRISPVSPLIFRKILRKRNTQHSEIKLPCSEALDLERENLVHHDTSGVNRTFARNVPKRDERFRATSESSLLK